MRARKLFSQSSNNLRGNHAAYFSFEKFEQSVADRQGGPASSASTRLRDRSLSKRRVPAAVFNEYVTRAAGSISHVIIGDVG